MAPQIQGRKIALLGAGGQLGTPMLKALLAQGVHSITALQRKESTSTFPETIDVRTGDLEDEEFLVDVLKGQEVLVLMPPLAQLVRLQKPAVRAAAKAAVPYILPSEFGPDPSDTLLVRENALLQDKKAIRDLIDDLGVSSWVSVSIGPWLDVSLKLGLWGIEPEARKATIWKGADARVSTATVQHTAEVAAAVLSLPDVELAKYKGRAVYAPSWHFTQQEIFDAVLFATDTTSAEWEIEEKDIKTVVAAYEAKIEAGDIMGHFQKFYTMHFFKDSGGDFERKANATDIEQLEGLGLQREDVLEAIKAAVKRQ